MGTRLLVANASKYSKVTPNLLPQSNERVQIQQPLRKALEKNKLSCSRVLFLHDVVNLPVTAWAKAILHNLHKDVAGISAYVDDKVIRSPSWTHLQILLERTIHFDRLGGQFLNFDKSMGLCTTKDGMKKLKELSVEGTPLLIMKNAKSLGALVTTTMNPKSFVAQKRVDNAILTLKRLQHLPIELAKKAFFINAKVAPQACFGATTIEIGRGRLKALEASIVKTLWGSHHA
jgi:hypothetical protein